jgi:hypothetical protein
MKIQQIALLIMMAAVSFNSEAEKFIKQLMKVVLLFSVIKRR